MHSFLLESESTIVRSEGKCQWKIPKKSTRVEPATFWLVAQRLNQLRHRVDDPGLQTRLEQKIFLFSETSRPDETQPATCSTGISVLSRGKSAGASCSVEADNDWSYTSTTHWRFHGLNRDKFTFSYLLTSISWKYFLRRHRVAGNTVFSLGCSQHTGLQQIFRAQIYGTDQIPARNFGLENFKLPILHGTGRFRSVPTMLVVPHPLYWLTKCSSSPCQATYLWQIMKLHTAQESFHPTWWNLRPRKQRRRCFSVAFSVSSVLFGLIVTAQHGLKPCMMPGAPYLLPLLPPSALNTSKTQLDELVFTTHRYGCLSRAQTFNNPSLLVFYCSSFNFFCNVWTSVCWVVLTIVWVFW